MRKHRSPLGLHLLRRLSNVSHRLATVAILGNIQRTLRATNFMAAFLILAVLAACLTVAMTELPDPCETIAAPSTMGMSMASMDHVAPTPSVQLVAVAVDALGFGLPNPVEQVGITSPVAPKGQPPALAHPLRA